MISGTWIAAAVAAMPAVALAQSAAQAYPVKVVRIVVPYTAGGGTDSMARLTAQKLSEAFGQQVIVENRPGASGNIGLEMVAKSPGDGYTLVMMPSNHSINPSLFGNLPFDPIRDFTPIVLVGSSPVMVAAHGSVPAKSIKEFLSYARSRPGKLSYASCGNGTPQHLAGELLKSMTKLDMQHIPYKGCSEAIADILNGQVQIAFSTVANLNAHVRSGKISSLAVTSIKRSALAPAVPTVAESGLQDYDVDVWFGLLGPANMPVEVVQKINGSVNKFLSMADVREKMLSQFYEPYGGTPAQFGALIKSEMGRWSTLINSVGIKAD